MDSLGFPDEECSNLSVEMFREGKYMVIYLTPTMHKTLIRNSKEQLRSTVGAEGPNYAVAPLGCRPRRG